MFRATVKLVCGLCLLVSSGAHADIVKPALIEITVNTNGTYSVEIRASIEALLTGINARYRNTQDAPNAAAYDELRVLQAPELRRAFAPFEEKFLHNVRLQFDQQTVPLQVSKVVIPEPGYTKVPRISVIYLEGRIAREVRTLTWYYPEAFGDNAVRVRQVDEHRQQWHWSDWQWMRNDETSDPFSLTEVFTRQPLTQTIATYLGAGFSHIMPRGRDHILFILGIFLFSVRLRPLLWQVTMFTIAHTITLGLSTRGVISLPAQVVEPLIALSIAYVGVENIFAHTLHRSRLLLVFGFGLLHGMSFASVLQEFGLPDDAFFTALFSFNIGVELGQLALISIAFLTMGLWFSEKSWYRGTVVLTGSAAIGAIGLYWTWDRLAI